MEHSRGNLDHHGIRWSLGGGGYQFYTTSPTVEWATWKNPSNDFCPGGSLIYAPAPRINHESTSDEVNSAKIYAQPLLTTVEEPPKLQDGETKECQRVPTPANLIDTNETIGLNRLLKVSFKLQDIWQINGICEPVSYYSFPETKTDSDLNQILTGYETCIGSIMNAWLQPGGLTAGYNFQGITQTPTSQYDIIYDIAPKQLKKGIEQMPDGDWPDRCCLRSVAKAGFYAPRLFVILHTANDEFLCWPLLDAMLLDEAITTEADPKLLAQAYKSNVPEQYTQRASVPWPDWVYAPTDKFRDDEPPEQPKPRPRYTFTFDSAGTKAVAAVVQRSPLLDTSIYRTAYTDPESGDPLEIYNWYKVTADRDPYKTNNPGSYYPLHDDLFKTYHAPVETKLEVNATIDGHYLLSRKSDRQPFMYDRKGFVEVGFDIELTGENLEDFTFSVSLRNSKSPEALDAFEIGALVDAAYAKPMILYPGTEQINPVNPITQQLGINRSAQLTADTSARPEKDQLITAFIELYRTQEQKELDETFLCCTEKGVSKSQIKFYAKDFYKQKQSFLALPIVQRHGKGYVGKIPDDLKDFVEPPIPHADVDNKTSMTIDQHRPPDDPRAPVYIYQATIYNLDLSTLSFIYCLTVSKQSTEDSYVTLKYSKESVEQTEMCNVYIFGKIAEESFVGVKGDQISYLQGMADAPTDDTFIQETDLLIPTTFKNYTGGLKFDYYENAYASMFSWWLEGLCFKCVYGTLLDALWNYDLKDEWDYAQGRRKHASILVHDPFKYSPITNFKVYTEDEAADYLRYAIEDRGGFIAGTVTRPYHDPNDFENILLRSFPKDNSFNDVDICYGNQNPFYLARMDFDPEDFIERTKKWFTNVLTFIAELVGNEYEYIEANNIFPPDNTPEQTRATILLAIEQNYTFMVLLALELYAPFVVRSKLFEQEYYFGLSDLNPNDNKLRLNNFDYGTHLYNHYLTHSVIGYQYNIISTTIEGHYSYYFDKHYRIKRKYSTYARSYANPYDKKRPLSYWLNEGGVFYANTFYTEIGNTEGLDGDSFEWNLIEGVGWYCGKLKVSHLDYYNMAFDEDWRNNRREEGRPKPYTLKYELPIETKYSHLDFRPSFDIKLSTNNELLYNPNRYNANTYQTLQLEQNGLLYTTLGLKDNNDYAFDDRSSRKHIRLSPLFF